MGIEYKLTFAYDDASSVCNTLRSVAGSEPAAIEQGQVEFRADPNDRGMPDAIASIEPWGVYFCDFGGEGRRYLGEVLAKLVCTYEPISISEL